MQTNQSVEERIKQIPEFSARLLADIQKLAAQYENPEEIPNLPRLEIRQKMSLAI